MLLQLHEAEGAAAQQKRLDSVLHALSLFCAARPALLVPHVELLPNYLQYDDEFKTVVHHVCEMLPKLLPLLDHPNKGLLEKLERLLGALVFRAPEHLLQPAIAALCCTVAQSHNYQLLHTTLAIFCQMMTRAKDPADPAHPALLHRSILSAGLLCRYFDFEAPGAGAQAYKDDGELTTYEGDFTKSIFDQLRGFLPSSADGEAPAPAPSSTVALYALKAIGHVCVRRHDLLLACHATLSGALRPAAPPQLKQQALSNLLELLKQPAAPTQAKESASQSAAEASAAVSGTLQQHQAALLACMAEPRHPAVRREALLLLRAMLEQGLVHPMACIPQLMALELDTAPKSCAQMAQEVLRKLYERHRQMVCSPGVAMQGVAAAYRLQRAMRALEPPGAPPPPTPRFMFELMQQSRKERLGYIKAVVGLLHPNQLDAADAAACAAIVERGAWVAQSLAGLPYDKEDDTLTLVYHLNRQLSLHADTILQALATQLGDVDEADPLAAAAAIELRLAAAPAGDFALGCSRQSDAAGLVCLLLQLKQHVKYVYQLNAGKCQVFEPSETSSLATGRLGVRVPNKPPLDVGSLSRWPPKCQQPKGAGAAARGKKAASSSTGAPATTPAAAATPLQGAALAVARLLWLRELLQADEAELDYNLLATQASTPRPKATAAKRVRNSGGGGSGGGLGGGSARAKASGKGASGKGAKAKKARKRKLQAGSGGEEDGDSDFDPEYK